MCVYIACFSQMEFCTTAGNWQQPLRESFPLFCRMCPYWAHSGKKRGKECSGEGGQGSVWVEYLAAGDSKEAVRVVVAFFVKGNVSPLLGIVQLSAAGRYSGQLITL